MLSRGTERSSGRCSCFRNSKGGTGPAVPPASGRGAAAAQVRSQELALGYPETREDHPWGHLAFKVRGKKVFLFLNGPGELGLSLSVKLPESADLALNLPFAEPTHYGLGKHGWVTARFAEGDRVPVAMLAEWAEESFRAVAPKALVRRLQTPPRTAPCRGR